MGTIQYGSSGESSYVDHRTLAHLHVVIATRFREGTSFSIRLPSRRGARRVTIWLDRTVPLHLVYAGLESVPLNPRWLDQLTRSSRRAGGLIVSPEPLAPVPSRGIGIAPS